MTKFTAKYEAGRSKNKEQSIVTSEKNISKQVARSSKSFQLVWHKENFKLEEKVKVILDHVFLDQASQIIHGERQDFVSSSPEVLD